MATTEAQKRNQKRYREKHREKRRADDRARAKTYRETVAANPDHLEKRRVYVKKYRAENRERRMLSDAKARAVKGGFSCTIELRDISISDKCPLLGVAFERKGPYAPSLDKIIPSLGYVPGNVMVISYRANAIKHNATLEELQILVANLSVLLALRGIR